jgi:LysR family glycine cleavage system transcriptional activator
MRPGLNLNWIRSFEAAARLQNFTEAGQELGMTQVGVSQHIRLLEQNLGEVLFHRLPRGVKLTDAGEAYLHVVKESLDRLRDGTRDIFSRRLTRQLVTVRCNVAFANHWLAPRLARFQASQDDISVRLLASVHNAESVWEGVDMEIRYDPDDSPWHDATLLFADALFPVCCPDMAERLRSPENLLAEHLIQVIGNRRGWNEWLRLAGLPEVDNFRQLQTDTSGLAISLAQSGAGVALGHHSLVEPLLASGQLQRPFELELKTSGVFYLIAPADRGMRAAARRFKAWLLSECNGAASTGSEGATI